MLFSLHNNLVLTIFSVLSIACISILLTWFLYRKDIKKGLENYLAFRYISLLRFASIFLILLLLFNFTFSKQDKEIIKPIIVFGIDNSKSMYLKDTKVQEKIQNNIIQLKEKLKDNYDIRLFTYGNDIKDADSINFNQNYTDIHSFLKYSYESFSDINLGAVILATDGIYNKNANPINIAQNHQTPIYTIAYGDTTVLKDIIVKKVRHNKTVLLNNYFPIECTIIADKLAGKQTKLTVEVNGNIVETKSISINKNKQIEVLNFSVQAKEKGNLFVKVQVEPIDEEVSLANNQYAFNINVIDDKKKIILLYNSPHPDISAIKQALKSSEEFEIEDYYFNEFKADINKYQIAIMHQLPSNTINNNNLTAIINNNIPKLFINGTQTNIVQFNNLNLGSTISDFNNSFNEVFPIYNTTFGLFTLNNDLQNVISKLPPIVVPYGRYASSNSTQILFSQKIGQVNTSFPLIAFSSSLTSKNAVIFGEGIWRWRIYDNMINQNTQIFDELIAKIFKFLATKEEKDRFQVNINQPLSEEDDVVFTANLYNETNELINIPDIQMSITDYQNKEYDFTFSKNNKSYSLNAGKFKLGNYNYKATTKVGSKILQKTGSFSIIPINFEALNTIADHQLLKNISLKTNAISINNSQDIETITKHITQNKQITSVAFFNSKILSLINYKLIMFIIILLMALEWGIRKYLGHR